MFEDGLVPGSEVQKEQPKMSTRKPIFRKKSSLGADQIDGKEHKAKNRPFEKDSGKQVEVCSDTVSHKDNVKEHVVEDDDDDDDIFKPVSKCKRTGNIRNIGRLRQVRRSVEGVKDESKCSDRRRSREKDKIDVLQETVVDNKDGRCGNSVDVLGRMSAKVSGISDRVDTEAAAARIRDNVLEGNTCSSRKGSREAGMMKEEPDNETGANGGSDEEFLNTRRKCGRKRKSTSRYLDWAKRKKKGVEYEEDGIETNVEKENQVKQSGLA